MPYDIVFYQRGPDQRAPKELRNIHPLGKSPVITDGDITLAESGAIIRVYLHLLLLVDLTDHMAVDCRVHYQQVWQRTRCPTSRG